MTTYTYKVYIGETLTVLLCYIVRAYVGMKHD